MTGAAPPIGNDVAAAERRLARIPYLVCVTPDTFGKFAAWLADVSDADSYLTSPAYYAFTGRNGLWVYRTERSLIPVCWHPNVPGQLLVFPIAGRHADLAALLRELPEPPNGIRIARVKAGNERGLAGDGEDAPIFVPVVENVLDWKFPVRILSTAAVAAMQGPDFRYIRNHVKQITGRDHRVGPVNDHIPALRAFVDRWAGTAGDDHAQAQRRNPYHALLDCIQAGTLRADGFVTLIDGAIEAITLWDVSNGDRGPTANRFVNITNHAHRGLAEFNTVHMARLLHAEGIATVNIGGAETVALDAFKAKFMPVRSIELVSVDVLPRDRDLDLIGRLSVEPQLPLRRFQAPALTV